MLIFFQGMKYWHVSVEWTVQKNWFKSFPFPQKHLPWAEMIKQAEKEHPFERLKFSKTFSVNWQLAAITT